MDRFLARELEIIAKMPRYYDWIIDCIRPHTAGRVVEIGAGIGALSERLLPQATELSLVEPSAHFVSVLRQRFEGRDTVSIHHMSVETFLEVRAEGECNTVVMANVLEHIEDDAAVLSGIRSFLGPGGKIAIFVPAMPFLYSKLDQAVGHYRRYTLRSLSEGLENTGFEIIDIRDEGVLEDAWRPFIHTHHFRIHRDTYDSWTLNHPRRTGEAFTNQFLNALFIEDNPVPRDLDLAGFHNWMRPLFDVEDQVA